MDVMMKITTEDVRRLRAQFSTNLTLDQFVPLMKSSLHDRLTNELDFIVGAIDLFHTIDVNGDRTLEWDEFAGYMLDAGLANKAGCLDQPDDHANKLYKPMHLPFRDGKTPMNRTKTYIQQLLHLPYLHAVAYFEHLADVVYLYALHFDQNDAPRHLATIRLHTAFQEHVVLGICFVSIKNWLVVSSMRAPLAYLSVWQLPELGSHSHSPMMLRRIELVSPQEQLTWLPSLQLLATASAVFPSISTAATATSTSSKPPTKIHQLLLWDLSTLTTLTDFDHRERIKGVTTLVGYTTPSNRVFLVAGRDDGQLTVVETETGHDIQTLDAHGHGVRVLALSTENEILASAGAHAYASDESAHHILIWRFYSNGRLTVDDTLRDHSAPLQLLRFVDSKQQLVSADIHGVFHVYSSALRSPAHEKWQCLQVFQTTTTTSLHHDAGSVLDCLVVPETLHSDAVMVAYGSRVNFYDLCVSREREEVIFSSYCTELNIVLAVTPTTLLVWKADTGTLWKSFLYESIVTSTPPSGFTDAAAIAAASASPRVISAVCVDDRERKVILGDDRGSIRVVNLMNGNVMKALDPHSCAVLWLDYVLHSKRVVSVSLDGVLHICDENNPVGYYVPFGLGGTTRPQSVLLQSLRLLPPLATATTPVGAHRHGKFEVVRAIANQKLNLVAVQIAGSSATSNSRSGTSRHSNTQAPADSSFLQLWNFDMSHAQGTCIAPQQDELTCVAFVGATSDLVAGTAKGKVCLWTAKSHAVDIGGYHCSVVFEPEPQLQQPQSSQSEEDQPQQPQPRPLAQIVHVLVVVWQNASSTTTTTRTTVSAVDPQTTTFITDDGAPSHTMNDQHHHNHDHSDSDSQNGLGGIPDGTYVVAADDSGAITTWFVHGREDSSEPKMDRKASLQQLQNQLSDDSTTNTNNTTGSTTTAPTTTTAAKDTSTESTGTSAFFQHEEMAMGYVAIAALHANAIKRDARQQQLFPHTVFKRPAWRWQAHGSSVTSLCQCAGDHDVHQRLLVSSSASGKIKIWTLQGELLGVLDHFATRRAPERRAWKFPVDMDARQQRKEEIAQKFLDRHRQSASYNSRRLASHQRLSVLQERLSITPQEMASERMSMTPPSGGGAGGRRRRITTHVHAGDVSRAIRLHALAQASASANKPQPPHSQAYSQPHPASASSTVSSSLMMDRGVGREPSLHTILKELDDLQTSSSSSSPVASLGTSAGSLRELAGLVGRSSTTNGLRRRRSMTTVADLKHALRPRTTMATCQDQPLRATTASASSVSSLSKGKGTATERCELVALPLAPRPRQIIVTSSTASATDSPQQPLGRIVGPREFVDLRYEAAHELLDHEQHNHKSTATTTKTKKKSADAVLNYHVKLAHSWSKYNVS